MKMKRIAITLALLLAFAGSAFAQGPTATQQSSTQLTAATNCTTGTGAAAAAVTVTITPTGGNSIYLSYLEITNYVSAAETGNAAPNLITITGIPGAPVITMATAGATVGAAVDRYIASFSSPLKGLINTNVVITTPAFTGALWRVNACYNTAP